MIILYLCCYTVLLGTDSKVKYVSLLNNMIESHPLLAGMCTHVHVAMVILAHLLIAKLEDLSYPRTSDTRPNSNSRWGKAIKKVGKTASTPKSRKQLRERDSSKSSLRVK